jgi:hypothetical protein
MGNILSGFDRVAVKVCVVRRPPFIAALGA